MNARSLRSGVARAALVLLPALLVAAPARAAAQLTIVNTDAPGEGFNDPTPATPVGGNTGTTVGQQRLIAFERAAQIWGSILDSSVEIRVRAAFDPLDCDATSATLGAARPATATTDAPNAPLPGTWYPVALASKLAGVDVDPGSDDIIARFNSRLGEAGCLDGSGWYYGLDGANGPNQTDLVDVLLHEFGHGLGFLTLVDDSTGQEFLNQPDVFEGYILDASTNQHWTEMTGQERQVSATNTGNILWDGPAGVAAAPQFLGPLPVLTVDAPPAIAGDRSIGSADFGPSVAEAPVTGALVQALDASDAAGPTTTDGCSPLSNAAAVAGHVALVDRGTCLFVEKAANLQAAGAIAMVLANNVVAENPPDMGGDDPTITIPCVSITQADGAVLAANLPGVVVSLRTNPRRLAGAGAGSRPLLYAPDPDEPGSSISHFDTSATPNLLMEPNINGDLGHDVDLTLPVLRDLGWSSDAAVGVQARRDPIAGDEARTTRTVPRP